MKLLLGLVLVVFSFASKASIITFSESDVSDYGSQSQSGGYSIFDSGSGLVVYGNNWVSIDLSSLSSWANSLLVFEFMTTDVGEINGVGFDNDNQLSTGGTVFQLGGTQTYGIQDYVIDIIEGVWYTVIIDLSLYDLSDYTSLVFIADQDTAGSETTSYFRNVAIVDLNNASNISEVSAPATISLFLGIAGLMFVRARCKTK